MILLQRRDTTTTQHYYDNNDIARNNDDETGPRFKLFSIREWLGTLNIATMRII